MSKLIAVHSATYTAFAIMKVYSPIGEYLYCLYANEKRDIKTKHLKRLTPIFSRPCDQSGKHHQDMSSGPCNILYMQYPHSSGQTPLLRSDHNQARQAKSVQA